MSSFLALKVKNRSANAIETSTNNKTTLPNCINSNTSTNDMTTINSLNTNA